MASGQTLTHFHPHKANLLSSRVADIWPSSTRAWLRLDMPFPPAYLENDSVVYLGSDRTSLNPPTNPLIGAYANNSGTTWLAVNRLPGWIEGPLGNSNGGLLRFQNNNFTLYNSLNFPSFSTLKETLWYSSAISPNFSKFWVGGDSGIRSIDLATFQVKRFFNDTITLLTKAYWREGKSSKTGVWFRRDSYQWAYQSADTLRLFNNPDFGFADSLRLNDIAFLGSDTFFLFQGPDQSARLWKRRAGVAMLQSLGSSSLKLQYLAVERDQKLWLLGESGLYSTAQQGYKRDTVFEPQGKTLSAFKIDPAGNKWICTLDSGLYRLSNLSATIVPYKGKSQFYCYTRPVEFKAIVRSSGGNTFQYYWQFGDGQTSTEAEPSHIYGWTGKFRIRLKVTDEFGAVAVAKDTLLLIYRPDIWMNPHQDTLYTCATELLKTSYPALQVQWHLPDGSTKTDSQLVASAPGLYYFTAPNIGCRGSDSIVISPRPVREGKIDIRFGPGDTLLEGDTINAFLPIQTLIQEVNPLCTSIWTVNDSSSGSTQKLVYTIKVPGKYEVILESSSLSNCLSEAVKVFYVKERKIVLLPPRLEISIPNLVLLNGYSRNDLFEIEALIQYPQNRISIYNSWGKSIFSASPYRNNWPGTEVQPGTYFYLLTIEGKSYQGWVEVIR